MRELQHGIKGSYCLDNGLLGDQYSVLALDFVMREKETCPGFFFFSEKDSENYLSKLLKLGQQQYITVIIMTVESD